MIRSMDRSWQQKTQSFYAQLFILFQSCFIFNQCFTLLFFCFSFDNFLSKYSSFAAFSYQFYAVNLFNLWFHLKHLSKKWYKIDFWADFIHIFKHNLREFIENLKIVENIWKLLIIANIINLFYTITKFFLVFVNILSK